MAEHTAGAVAAWQLAAAGLDELHGALTSAGFRVIGPRARGGAISLDELESASDLPFGCGVTLSPGGTGDSGRPAPGGRARRRGSAAVLGALVRQQPGGQPAVRSEDRVPDYKQPGVQDPASGQPRADGQVRRRSP